MIDFEYQIPPDLQRGEAAEFLPADVANWGIATANVEKLRKLYDGSIITVGIIDTGVDDTHPLLKSKIDYAEDFTGSRNGYHDVNGHGTHTTGTVGATDASIGVSNARLIHCKGLGDSGSGSSSALIRAMQKAVDKGAVILSCSWGSSGEDPNITAFLKDIAAAGVWPVFAAGNSGVSIDWPGRSLYAINTAALDKNLNPASFTGEGTKIDTSFAGVDIWSCNPGGGYQLMSGTSMATPGNAGTLAMYRHGLKALGMKIPGVEELRRLLMSDSMDVGTVGQDRRTGPGMISPILLSLNLTPDPPPLKP